jgi:hypothetical protein
MFSVCSSSTNCPSARCSSVADIVCKNVDVFQTKTVPLIIFYCGTLLIIKTLIVISNQSIIFGITALIELLLSKLYKVLRFIFLFLCIFLFCFFLLHVLNFKLTFGLLSRDVDK